MVSRLNEQMCKEIAQNGKGVYVRADNTTSAIRALKAELDKLQKKNRQVSLIRSTMKNTRFLHGFCSYY